MGGRRLGRRRLFALNKLGSASDATAPGPGMEKAVKTTVRREGHRIITEIAVDLGASGASIGAKDDADDVIGDTSGGAAYLTQITNAINGRIVSVEMHCAETPVSTNSHTTIDLLSEGVGTAVYDSDGSGMTKVINAANAWAAGDTVLVVADADDAGTEFTANRVVADEYLYLSTATAAGGDDVYTAGKYVITLEGIAVPDDM